MLENKIFICYIVQWGERLMNKEENSLLKRGRLLYIFEAALEYLIAILVASSFLATLTKQLGFSDSLTGILSSVISLGCLFQLLSLTINRKRSKGFVITLSIINQLLFMLLYVIPLSDFQAKTKTAIFVATIFVAYLIYYLAHPKKISWLMSLVDDDRRGIFTANKEIVSLIAGMIFSFVMGAVVDKFAEMGKIRIAFGISAAVMFVITVLHTLSLVFTVEKPIEATEKKSIIKNATDVFKNKNILKVTAVFVFYYIANYASVPFYGTYQINELGFSLKFVSLLTIFTSIVRILVSKFWGRYADKKSFAAMIEKCFLVLILSFICVIFSVPSNGKIMFLLYYIFHGIAMGGISSALINMIFDYAPYENRADALAISQATAGVTGFLTTLAISPLVSNIQKSGNVVFGIHLYAQQVVTVISLIVIVFAIIYIKIFFKKKPNRSV